MTYHAAPAELLIAAVSQPQLHAVSEHIESCAECSSRLRELREMIAAIHLDPAEVHATAHLTDDAIATFLDGNRSAVAADDLAHAARCAECQSRLASTWSALQNEAIATEIAALDAPSALRPASRVSLRFVGGIAAAAVAAIVLLGPVMERMNPVATQRETAEEPRTLRILAREPVLRTGDSLRWTSVRDADLYRIRIWTGDGTVVWTSESRDTVVAVPASLKPGTQYLWEVKARTGWDRWVASDFVSFTLRPR